MPTFCFSAPLVNNSCDLLILDFAEWTLYEQVAIAAMDCQCTDVAKVELFSSELCLPEAMLNLFIIISAVIYLFIYFGFWISMYFFTKVSEGLNPISSRKKLYYLSMCTINLLVVIAEAVMFDSLFAMEFFCRIA